MVISGPFRLHQMACSCYPGWVDLSSTLYEELWSSRHRAGDMDGRREVHFFLIKMQPVRTHIIVTTLQYVVFVCLFFSSAERVSRNGVQLIHMKGKRCFPFH